LKQDCPSELAKNSAILAGEKVMSIIHIAWHREPFYNAKESLKLKKLFGNKL